MLGVRFLFTCRHGFGHVLPLMPLARAVRAGGHEVAFATADPFQRVVQDAGFVAFTAGLSVDRWRSEFISRFGSFDQIPPTEYRPLFFGHVFTDLEVPARLWDLIAICDRWRPHVLVHEIAEFAGPIAAERAGIPYATCGVGPLLQPPIAELAGKTVGRHWQAAGLDARNGRMYRSLYLDSCPPSLQIAAIDKIEHRLQIRPETVEEAADAQAPPWLADLPAGPTVYVTLGTIFNRNLKLLRTVLEGLAAPELNVIATVGPDGDPAALGPQPGRVHLSRFLPQAQVLGRCEMVICHGGAGSTLGALAFGLPILILPRGADNFYNAERVLAAGAGRRLLDTDITPRAVANEVNSLLTDARYRAAATRIGAEIAAMPAPSAALTALEHLVPRLSPSAVA
ncbi:MAG: glycosyltransferase family 1 protein [Solirubrobacterales bacterium]|nr:glycosyltransferase family 1 protein [Solirubrobacterales bacterium]